MGWTSVAGAVVVGVVATPLAGRYTLRFVFGLLGGAVVVVVVAGGAEVGDPVAGARMPGTTGSSAGPAAADGRALAAIDQPAVRTRARPTRIIPARRARW